MFRWRSAARARSGPALEIGGPEPVEEQSCPGLRRALERLLRERDKPEVLDLGPLCGATVMHLAERGCRVGVHDFQPPAPPPPRREGQPAAEAPPFAVDQENERFDLVLAWERFDYTPPARLAELGREIHRILAPGGYVLLFCRDEPGRPAAEREQPARFRLIADDRLVREPAPEDESPRWSHPNRHIEAALSPLSIQNIHLQRNRVREFLAFKR